MSKKRILVGIVAIVCVLASVLFAANKNFVPDVTFTGST